MQIATFTFNDFAENTYVLFDETGECAIVDPGCNSDAERHQLESFIEDKDLTPKLLINTHAHIDHVFGVNFVHVTYGLDLYLHSGEKAVLEMVPQIANMYGLRCDSVDVPLRDLVPGESIKFGSTVLDILFTPGHSPASVCFYHRATQQVIAGDVLFLGSIGRTDLPGGDYDTLISSIVDQLLPLGDDVQVYPGHGPATSIGIERQSNPFLQGLK